MIDGLEVLQPLGGTQNVVLKVALGSEVLVLRLTRSEHRTVSELDAELTLLTDLHLLTNRAIVPRPFRSGRFIESIWYEGHCYNAVLFPYVVGRHCVSPSFETALRIGEVAANLHTALEALTTGYNLLTMQDIANPNKLIHGDFGSGNLLETSESFVAIDFENACYSSFEYKLGNSIYMMIFDHRWTPHRLEGMEYARGLLAGYQRRRTIETEQVVAAIRCHIARLSGWLQSSASAPAAVFNSTLEWKQTAFPIPEHSVLPRRPVRTSGLSDFVQQQDIFYVGGGSAVHLLALWRARGSGRSGNASRRCFRWLLGIGFWLLTPTRAHGSTPVGLNQQ